MDPEMRQKIFEVLELSKENNQMLRVMRRNQRWMVFFRVFYWIVLIGIALGAFYFLQPYVAQIKSFGSSLPNAADLQAFFKHTDSSQ